MDVQEVLKTVENIQGDVSAGIIVVLYYLVVYWPRIKDGLGLSRSRKLDFDSVEKNYQLLKLRIEIEQMKKESTLDSELLEQLEAEMLARQAGAKYQPFTSAQKFVAIPLIIFVILLFFMELQGLTEDSENSLVDTISGGVFVILITVVGFWGVPVLQKVKKGWLRKTGFITFWTFGFYIISYFILFITATAVLDQEDLSDSVTGFVFLASLIGSVVLGGMGRLPFMKVVVDS